MSASKLYSVVLVIIICTSFAFAVEQGGSDIAVLTSGVGARALGMGGAFTAIADNADAPYWNAAGLSNISSHEITTMQTRLSSDTDHYYISYAGKFLRGTFGFSWIQVSLGNISRTTTTDAFNEVITTNIFSYFSNAYMLSYGFPVSPAVALGMTAKYLTSDMLSIAGGQAYGYSVTPALMIRPKGNYSIGFKIDELMNEQKWGTGTVEKAPPKARLGIAFNRLPIPGSLFSIDFAQTLRSNYSGELALGYEWSRDNLSLRMGMLDSNLTAGAGFKSGITSLDYAYVQQSSLSRSNVHRLSLSGKW